MYFSVQLFVIVSVFIVASELASAISTRDYIESKRKETKDLLIKIYSQHVKDEETISSKGNWVKLWSEAPRTKQPRAISLSDQMFIIDGKQVFSIDSNPVALDNIRAVRELDLASSQDTVKFVKIFSWNGSIFLLVCQANTCTHYYGTDISHLEKREIIVYNGLIPVDACYFTRENHLYLVISYNLNNDATASNVPSKIYQWSGTTMDFTQDILTPAARAVSTLQDDQSTILLFALGDNLINEVDINSGCVVYELRDDSSAEFVPFSPNVGFVTAIYPYYYNGEEYAFLTGDEGSSGIFLWDGDDLQKWISVPNVKATSLINVVHVNNETLLFVCNSDAVHIYRIVNRECIHINDLILNGGQQVVEIAVWEYENSIMLLLIKLNPNATYQIELWQLTFHEEQSESVQSDEVWNCLNELKNLLDARMPIIENLTNSWPKLVPASKNSTKATPLQLSELVLDGGSISLLEFDNKDNLNVSSPLDVKNNLLSIEKTVDAVLSSSKNINSKENTLLGDVVVEGDVTVENLYIDKLSVEYLNDEKINMNDFFISGSNQSFAVPLQARSIYIDNLEVPSLCGLDSDHWLQVNDTRRTRLDDIIDRSKIFNDTISLDRDVTLNELNTKYINGVNITHFLEDVFVIGKNQVIKGNVTYEGIVIVSKLTTDEVNNVTSSSLITRYTNQTLGDVYIETLKVNHLNVEKINGVPVNQSARMSQENVIKGQVTIGNFIITDELIINENITLPFDQSMQVYDEVLINGDVYMKNLEIEADASLTIGHDILSSQNIHNILENSWSKSSDQVISKPIVFQKGASIDELSCQYLNGLREEDFLYVDSREMNDLENVTFTHFHFDKVVNQSSGVVEKFYEESAGFHTFLRAVRISNLSVDNIITDTYNGIPIETIMQANDSLEFSGISEFDNVQVDGRMIVGDLKFNRLNRRNVIPLNEALLSHQNLQIETLKTSNINIRNVQVKNLNGHDLEEGLLAQNNFANQVNNVSLTVEGEIEIENELKVDLINEQETSDYIDVFKDVNLIDLIETKNMNNLLIMENLNVTLLNGQNINEVFSVALSKSKKQIIPGEFIVSDATAKYLKTGMINNKNVLHLMYTDKPCIFTGNVSFSELLVQGNIVTKTLKGKLVSEIQKELQMIPLNDAITLHVFGNATWDEPSSNLLSLNNLLNNAVTKHENQIINSAVTFEEPLVIDSLYLQNKDSLVLQKINDIVNDAVVDSPNGDPVLIKGTKIFKKELVASDLEVTNNIDINNINGLNVKEAASNIFQKHKNDTVSSQVTFLGEVEIGNLITTKKIHGVSLHELAAKDKKMPEYLHFDHLIVQGNVTLYKLDGVDFDAFMKNRIDIREDYEIYKDVQFDDTVTVTNESYVSSINGIRPTNLVLSDPTGVPTIIYGSKTFTSGVVVEHNIEATTINNINVREMYDNSILSDQSGTIVGDLIFEDDVETSGDIKVSGSLNKLKPEQLVEAHTLQKQLATNLLNGEEYFLQNSISNSANSFSFAKQLLYLEKEESLDIQIPGVYSVRGMQLDSTTRLDVYSTEEAEFCGLPSNCSCRRQYVVEISPSNDCTIHEEKSSDVTFNFYEANGLGSELIKIGLKVVSGSVSSSERCSKKLSEPEKTQIFWRKFGKDEDAYSQEPALEVEGFVADAQIFVVTDRIYLILAIFYDKTTKSHATESLVYELNLQTKKANTVQSIATDGAKALHVFRIIDVGVYVLVGCVKGKAESLLFRFNLNTRQFQLVRSFSTGGSKHIASVSGTDRTFVILNNPDIEALQIFAYDAAFDNFYEYQNLYFDFRVTSLNVFYAGEFGNSEAYVVATTKDGTFYIYEYMFFGKFQLKMSYWEEDIQVLSPFRHANQNYLLAGLKSNSTILRFIEQGSD